MDFSKVKSWTINGKEVKTLEVGGQIYWQKKEEPPVECKAFYIEDCSGGANTFSITKEGEKSPTINLEYSTDGGVWQEWVDCQTNPLTIEPNGRIYLRGTNNTISGLWFNFFKCTSNFNIGGDITSMLSPDGGVLDLTGRNKCFKGIFTDAKNLISAKNLLLPSTTISDGCYAELFKNCTSLTEGLSILPAKIASSNCYFHMFSGCTSLTKAPAISATTTEAYSCTCMFLDCSSLVEAPVLLVTNPYGGSYDSMFYRCTNLKKVEVKAVKWSESRDWLMNVSPRGTFIKPKELVIGTYNGQIPNGSNGIPSGWEIIEK